MPLGASVTSRLYTIQIVSGEPVNRHIEVGLTRLEDIEAAEDEDAGELANMVQKLEIVESCNVRATKYCTLYYPLAVHGILTSI